MTVRIFESGFFGAQTVANTAGEFITKVLDVCLINGLSLPTISSITKSGTTATVTTGSAHGLRSLARATISGASDSLYNGEFPITVTGTTSFTYTMSGTPAANASGTLVGAIAGAGWTKTFSGTNKAVYRPGSGNQFYLRFDDTGTTSARVKWHETMSDVDTGTSLCPTEAQVTGGLHQPKSSSATARAWKVIATDKAFYVWIDNSGTITAAPISFYGDIPSYKAGDIYNTLIVAATSAGISSTDGVLYTISNPYSFATNGTYLVRGFGQTGTSITAAKATLQGALNGSAYIGSAGETYPTGASGGLLTAPVYIHDVVAKTTRGYLPGLLAPLHNLPLTHNDTFTIGSKTYLVLTGYSSGQGFIEITNGW